MKLTATTVRTAALPAGKTEAIFFDDDIPGFGLRLREGGSRSFVFQYKLGDKHRRMALGKATALNLIEIRKLALQHYASVRRGEDPAADKACAKFPRSSNPTSSNISVRCASAFGPDRSRK